MPLWNSSKKEPETVTMDKASGSKQLCSEETRDIRRSYEFKEVLGTYVSFDCFVLFVVIYYYSISILYYLDCLYFPPVLLGPNLEGI